ncbi:uncharacterized protein LOC141844044 [Curcuma longa]|uniref:uncharacterized protein LOC141844044 n=1 Tax=Curcuma longa TaxID=136217 RepID=UPI003D9F3AC0
MAEEIVASPTVLVNGENEANNTEFADAVAVEEEKTSDKDAAAASGDRDAAVELLIEEIRDLKKARLDLQRERSGLLSKLTSTESELNAVAAQASRLEGQLRIVQDDLSTANMSASEHEEEIRRLQDVIKDLEANFKIKVRDLNEELRVSEQKAQDKDNALRAKELELDNFKIKVRDLNEELRVSEQKAQDKDNALRAKELELEELRSQIVDEKEKNLQNRDMQGGVSASLTQSRALGTASAVGVAAVALGTLVCLYLAKRK